jgi:hypothetical protein
MVNLRARYTQGKDDQPKSECRNQSAECRTPGHSDFFTLPSDFCLRSTMTFAFCSLNWRAQPAIVSEVSDPGIRMTNRSQNAEIRVQNAELRDTLTSSLCLLTSAFGRVAMTDRSQNAEIRVQNAELRDTLTSSLCLLTSAFGRL